MTYETRLILDIAATWVLLTPVYWLLSKVWFTRQR